MCVFFVLFLKKALNPVYSKLQLLHTDSICVFDLLYFIYFLNYLCCCNNIEM